MKAGFLALALAAAGIAAPYAHAAEQRFPEIPIDKMNAEQKAIAAAIASGPRKSGAGPFNAWLRSPALADVLQKVGAYVRFQSSLPKAFNEFAILMAGRYWNSQFEWAYHYPLAIEAGVSPAVLAELGEGKAPAGMSFDEALVYRFTSELRRTKAVSDETYAAALARFGERGILDMIAIAGYYDIVCMTLNVAQVPTPLGSTAPPLPSLPTTRD